MSNKVQEATKELNLSAGKLYEEATRARRSAQDVIAALKKLEGSFVQKENAQREQQRAQD